MNFTSDLAQYIAANAEGFTPNSNLFIGEISLENYGVYIVATPSPAPDMYTDVETHSIDFWSRYKTTQQGMDQLNKIYNLIHQNHHYATNNYYIYFSYATTQIVDQDRDAVGSKLLSLSVIFILRNLIS